jgi:signal transduction histidine kinase
MVMSLVPFSPDELVESSMQSVSGLADERQVTLESEIKVDGTLILADPEYAVQVLVNLLANAIKFSSQGQTVKVEAELLDDFVFFSVIDSGPGVPDEFRHRLFNRFEQAKMAKTEALRGSGIGLYMSKMIVEHHDGSIGVDSTPGQGSRFWFTLPRQLTDPKFSDGQAERVEHAN